ncbi:MAG: GTPase HflX [Desulfohalobiaceae bacterium]|nr:GTPase HflX [Desulfohalobiaceae bacterium]
MAFVCQPLIAGRQKEKLSVSISVIRGQSSAFLHSQNIRGRLPTKRCFKQFIRSLDQENLFIAYKIRGNTAGLKPSRIKSLTRLYGRRFSGPGGYSLEQARELAGLSQAIGRQIGLLINRQGKPEMVIAGDRDRILIPELGRQRQTSGRLRGLRLLHTHLGSPGLSEEDLLDMVFLRLDSVGVFTISQSGDPDKFQWAHLLPYNPGRDPYLVSEMLPWDRNGTDFSAQVEALESELSTGTRLLAAEDKEKAVLISVGTKAKKDQADSLAELRDLLLTAGMAPTETLVQRVKRINPNYILGRGKLAELEVLALQAGASSLVFDCELSPAQMRNLAEITERKILDRTQVILDIFAQHATSREGKLQVELAQLDYTLPRLVGKNRALSRLAGGIGGRGPGETKLEMDRRRIRARRTRVRQELAKVRQQRKATRARRNKAGLPIVALVGYTNAGKSTLLNTLTRSSVYTADKLFATLDPTNRRLRFPEDREIILADTVGFISYLPEYLQQAFMATLEELDSADILVHVADASHPEVEHQCRAVVNILQDLKLEQLPRILVLNKWDRTVPEQKNRLHNLHPEAIPLTALDNQTLAPLTRGIMKNLPAQAV